MRALAPEGLFFALRFRYAPAFGRVEEIYLIAYGTAKAVPLQNGKVLSRQGCNLHYRSLGNEKISASDRRM